MPHATRDERAQPSTPLSSPANSRKSSIDAAMILTQMQDFAAHGSVPYNLEDPRLYSSPQATTDSEQQSGWYSESESTYIESDSDSPSTVEMEDVSVQETLSSDLTVDAPTSTHSSLSTASRSAPIPIPPNPNAFPNPPADYEVFPSAPEPPSSQGYSIPPAVLAYHFHQLHLHNLPIPRNVLANYDPATHNIHALSRLSLHETHTSRHAEEVRHARAVTSIRELEETFGIPRVPAHSAPASTVSLPLQRWMEEDAEDDAGTIVYSEVNDEWRYGGYGTGPASF